jgi:three-Cys-motif partner protein
MSKSPEPMLWTAEPHTIAKIEIVENYLERYFLILGSQSPDDILYVDGFAGPGKYTNHSTGSPLAALRAAKKALATSAPRVIARKIHFVFIEDRKDRYEHLMAHVEPFKSEPRFNIIVIHGSFASSVAEIERLFPNAFKSMRSFFFVDPFGPTHVPFLLCERILKNQKSELLLNLDADGIARIFSAGAAANAQGNLTSIFGEGADWNEFLASPSSIDGRARASLKAYKQRLFLLPGVKYVYSYEMRGKTDRINYFLLFASHHPSGLEKMKEAMKAINKDGSYIFSDARLDQHKLFSDDDPNFYAEAMLSNFKGQDVARSVVEQFALNETPYTSATKPLTVLQAQNRIEVIMFPGISQVRKGAFPNEKVKSIKFK